MVLFSPPRKLAGSEVGSGSLEIPREFRAVRGKLSSQILLIGLDQAELAFQERGRVYKAQQRWDSAIWPARPRYGATDFIVCKLLSRDKKETLRLSQTGRSPRGQQLSQPWRFRTARHGKARPGFPVGLGGLNPSREDPFGRCHSLLSPYYGGGILSAESD